MDFELHQYRPGKFVRLDPRTGEVLGVAPAHEAAIWLASQRGPAGSGSSLAEMVELGQSESERISATAPPEPERAESSSPVSVDEEASLDRPEESVWLWPLDREFRLASSFQDHLNRRLPSRAPGIDLACSMGSEIRSMAAGRVIRSRWSSVSGRYLWIQHGGRVRSYYAHLDSASVLEGERVTAGQTIGKSGNSGQATVPHLHFSLVRDGEYVDPIEFLHFDHLLIKSGDLGALVSGQVARSRPNVRSLKGAIES